MTVTWKAGVRGLSLSTLQPLGRALMLPIAVLPVAGLLLRLGQPDMLGIPFVAAAGDAVFHNLGLLFALGVAVGLARDGNGAAGLAGVVCYLVAVNGAESLISPPPTALAGFAGKARELAVAAYRALALFRLGVPLGIVSGLVGGFAYNRFGAIKLPDALAFFGGRRFAPIVGGFAGVGLALGFGLGWTWLGAGIDALSRAIVVAGPAGLFLYGVLNRLLIVTGLHHILNNVVWFIVGDYHGATGDLSRFFAGDPTAGGFMAGFFPVMMFGLPAACLAMFHAARPERRAEVGGLLLSLALTAMLTGVTEPIEFSFMFLAPVLFAAHAVMTGAAMVIMDLLGVKLGFGFSAGLFDYLLNFGKATRPLLLLPVGAAYFALYYGVFRVLIVRLDLKTPGREDEAARTLTAGRPGGPRAAGFIAALGGAANLVSVDACTTRLRLVVADPGSIDEAGLKALGARGVVRPSPRDIQVVLGPIADQVAREINQALETSRADEGPRPVARWSPPDGLQSTARPEDRLPDPGPWLRAMGGAANIRHVRVASSRLRLLVADDDAVDIVGLEALGARGLVRPGQGVWHVVLGPAAEPLGASFDVALAAAADPTSPGQPASASANRAAY
jgi:PTS system N-acetylglucosamine-specific IIC component